MIEYKEGYAYIDDFKFRRDSKSGYFLSTKKIGTSRIRLHRYVWEKVFGKIPQGYEVHHKDENKDNNNIENLELLTKKKHLEWHADNVPAELEAKWVKNLKENARPRAIEWHKSEEGRKWHKENAYSNYEKADTVKRVCVQCEKSFMAINYGNKNFFCSRACAAAERRANGKDDEKRICVICNESFMINKYRKNTTCSRKCGAILKKQNRS